MPLPGGSSDKIGNRFELWWTALCLIDILDERTDSIVIEPPGKVGDGIEFFLTKKGLRQYCQVKRQTAKGLGWSIAALDSNDVLKHIPAKIGGNANEFHFVSTMAAPELSELSENARQSGDFAYFQAAFLGSNQRVERWNDLCMRWPSWTEPECYDIVRRTHVDTISEEVLRNQVLARASALVDGPDRQVANELVVFALDSINTLLTPDMLWNRLRAGSLPRRNWASDPHALRAVDDNNRRFLESRRREFFRDLFPQPLTAAIIDDVCSVKARNTLVSAPAGGGKSGLLVQVIEELERAGVPYLAIRVDRLDPTLRTPAQIGEKLDLPGSPASVLGAIAQGRRSVLILDQLDAVSLISGKNPDLFDTVCDLLQEVTAFPKMCVVAACRAFDLENDHRLKKLAAEPTFVSRRVDPLAPEYVSTGVYDAGFESSSLSSKQIELLSNPLSLSMLASLKPSSRQPVGIETSVELFDRFWRQKLLDLGQSGVTPDQFETAIDTLCELLERRGALFVPEPLFTHPAGEKLASAHILSRTDRQWGFFHESFYDFANARRLYRVGKPLPEYLKEHGQRIELRNQLRQSLAFRRAHDPNCYHRDLKDLLAEASIRFHLKSAAVAFLRAHTDPTAAEWGIVEILIERAPGSDLATRLLGLVGLVPAWYHSARDSGAISRWLTNPAIHRLLAWILFQVERRDPEEAFSVLREACTLGSEGKKLAASVLDRSELGSNRSIFDLYLELLQEGLFTPVGQSNRFPWLHIYRIVVNQPAWACEVLGMLLRKAIQTASSRGETNPFSPDVGLLADEQLDDEVIQRAQQGAPIKFLEEMWPSIVTVITANLEQDGLDGPPYRDKIWHFYDPQFNHKLHEKIINGVAAGIRALAETDFEKFSNLVNSSASVSAITIQWLLLQGFASSAQDHPEEALAFLLADTRRLNVGWSGESTERTRELIEKASQTCSDETLAKVETVLLDWYPPWEKTAFALRNFGRSDFGHSQYLLLSALPASRRSQRVRRRLQEWERKFGPLRETQTTSNIVRGGLARSPISSEAADRMTDEQWLAALVRHSSAEFNLRADGTIRGGMHELAQELQRVAQNDRSRFAKLIERLPGTTNAAYFAAIVIAMADESVPAEVALAVCRKAHDLDGKPLGHWIPYCLGKACVKAPSPETISMIGEYTSATYSTEVRGSALLNLGNLLRADRAGIAAALPYLESLSFAVPRELRSSFCYTLTPLFGTAFQARVKALFHPMWVADPWLPADHSVDQFLHFAFMLERVEFKEITEALLKSSEPKMRTLAVRRAALSELVSDNNLDLTSKLAVGDQYSRKGVAEVCAANVRFDKFRDACVRQLKILFHDAEPEVRNAASECFRDLEGDNMGDLWDLVDAFLASPSVETSLRSLLDALRRSTVRHDMHTLRACEYAIENVARRRELAHSELSICRDLALRTYHQSSEPVVLERSLDLIDRLLGLEVQGLEEALLAIESRR